MFDILTVGYLTVDSIHLPSRPTPISILGGACAYTSIAARRLGSRVAAISAVGDDFPKAYTWWLQQEGIDISRVTSVPNSKTTRFELKYSEDLSVRTLTLKNRGPAIEYEGQPEGSKATIVHLAPIAGEIEPALAENLKKQADFVSLDSQGLLRHFDNEGRMSLGKPFDEKILSMIDICKSSVDEIAVLTGQSELARSLRSIHDYGVKIVLVTNGPKGALLSSEGMVTEIPAIIPDKIADPTGAGDAFVGGFLSEYVIGSNLLRCACVGSAAASFVVESIGPTRFGDREEVYVRARGLYEKGIKQ